MKEANFANFWQKDKWKITSTMMDNKEADYTEWMIREVYMDVSILDSNSDYLSVVND